MVLDYSQAVDDDDDSEGVSVDSDDSDGGFNSIVDEDDNTPLHSQFQAMSVGSSSNSRKVPYTGPSLCVVCCRRPAYSKGGKSYPTCGLTCAAKYKPGQHSVSKLMCVICGLRPSVSATIITCDLTCAATLCAGGADPTQCDYCHRKPKSPGYQQCSISCRDKAKLACLMCRSRPRHGRYHLCGKTCKEISLKSTPLILEAPPGHDTFTMVVDKFKSAWSPPKSQAKLCPTIKKVYKIIESQAFLKPYDSYRRSHGNEQFRYHGTSRQCSLGNPGNTKLCASKSCALCSILRTSFKVSLADRGGAFGRGIYTSSASNKASSYSTNGAMLLTKVVLGKVRKVSAFNEVMSLPSGFDSVVFDRMNGQLNETVIYNDNAIRPVFLIIF